MTQIRTSPLSVLSTRQAHCPHRRLAVRQRLVSAPRFIQTHYIAYFRDVGGRLYPVDPDIPVFMPQDEQETRRLDHEHNALKLVIGRNYVGPVDFHLRNEPRFPRKRVLDIGTQQGTWSVSHIYCTLRPITSHTPAPSLYDPNGYLTCALSRVQEMASEFPHVEFVSLDLSPMAAHTPRENVAFEVYNFHSGLAEPDASFDVAHMRHTASKVTTIYMIQLILHRLPILADTIGRELCLPSSRIAPCSTTRGTSHRW